MEKIEKSNSRSLYFSKRIRKATEEIFNYPLTIVEAPMGYGKTTAIREYLNNSHVKIMWQRVYDSSVDSFWTGFCNQFSKLDNYHAQGLQNLGFPNDNLSIGEALTLIEGVVLTEKTVLVIDDYHLISGENIHNFLNALVLAQIENFHIVLMARYVGIQNTEDLKLKGYLNYITIKDLQFNVEEIINYYKLCGIKLETEDADSLYVLSEGWISALYLMMLNYLEEGTFTTATNIYKLVEKVVYLPMNNNTKEFLLSICSFDYFTLEQANFMSQSGETAKLLNEIINKNAFVKFDTRTKTYQIHNILTKFLKDILENKDSEHKNKIYGRAAEWFYKTKEYMISMHYFYLVGNFKGLLEAFELDLGGSFHNEHKDIIIRYFEECAEDIKYKHPVALLIYAIVLFTYNEIELFGRVCGEFADAVQSNEELELEEKNALMGEFEILLGFTDYNDINKMSEHHKKGCELLKAPVRFLDVKTGWTFGAPSIVYMFYREAGKLEEHVRDIKEAMPFYCKVTRGHGTGAEFIMEAEWHYNYGDLEKSEVAILRALDLLDTFPQGDLTICSRFLQVRIALMRGDYKSVSNIFLKMYEEMVEKKWYDFLHVIELSEAFINANLKLYKKIPQWICEGDSNVGRTFFPARAFLNIVYGRILLVKGEYLKLLGSIGEFIGIASVFPNLQGQIYTYIYLAAASNGINREDEALQALKKALDIAMEDNMYMPFVENCDYIMYLLDKLHKEDIGYNGIIEAIMKLYKLYAISVKKLVGSEKEIKFTKRENDIVKLVIEDLTNKEISKRLIISENTLKTQLKTIFAKVGVNSRALLKQYLQVEKK